MTPKIYAGWLEVLRDKKTKQVVGVYERDGAVCAIGALIKIAGHDAGFDDVADDVYDKVVSMNDGKSISRKKYKLGKIADWIESHTKLVRGVVVMK